MFRYVCIVFIFIKSVNSVDLSILRYNNSLYCMVSNERINSAITWDTGYDTISYDHYRMIKKGDLQNGRWEFKNTLENEFKFGPILDYRWESFPVNNESKYKLPSRRPFEIYISMQDTAINICETEGSEQCYKINFGDEDSFQKPPRNKWFHFTFRATAANSFHIEQYGKKNVRYDKRHRFVESYVLIASKWKIHSLNVYSSNTVSDQEIKLVNDFSKTVDICLGLFVHVCNTCTLTLRLYDRNNVEIDSIAATNKSQWEELQVCGKVCRGTDMKLSISSTSPPSEKVYIADNIRKFGKNDVRLTILRNVEDRNESHCCYDVMRSNELCTTERNEDTPLLPDFLSKEDADNITTIQNGTVLEVQLNIYDCTQIEVELLCTSQWCSMNDSETNITSYTSSVQSSVSVFTVLGNTNYTIKVRAYRNSSHIDTEKRILTAPTAPKAVQDLTAYSVTNSSVEIRWSEPYPPTGLVAYYLVHWEDHPTKIQRREGVFNEKWTFCKIWKNQTCSRFRNLLPNTLYTFRVQAKNLDVSEFGPLEHVRAITRNREPSGPENLGYIWNKTDDLILTWNHPSTPNGRITHFDIFKSIQRIATYVVTVEEFLYTYGIRYEKLNISSSEDIMINIYAFNSIGSQASTLLVSTPPKTPMFLEDPSLLEITATSVKIRISQTANIDGDHSTLYVIITHSKGSIANSKQNTDDKKIILKEANINTELNSWIPFKLPLDNSSREILIGDEMLDSDTPYEVTFFLRNEYRNIARHSTYTLTIAGPASQNYNFLLVFLVIPVICLIVFIIYKRHIKGSYRGSVPTDGIYEEVELLSTNLPKSERLTVQERLLAKNENCSNPIKLNDLENYVKQCLESQQFEKQYESLQTGQIKEWKWGMEPRNRVKNRHKDIAAYDNTRVKLKILNNDPYSDYIDANYIDGYDIRRSFIATEEPKSNTINNFWRMIWEQHVEYIIMIAKIIQDEKKKVKKYWPDINETNTYGGITVTLLEITVFPEYENRSLKIRSKGEERHICQLHFTCWSDHGMPFYAQTLVPFLKRILRIPHGRSPVVVHSSEGAGRTGTLILCDICLRIAAKSGGVDVYYQLGKLREQRINMVDDIYQYILVHLVLLRYLVEPDFTLQCTGDMSKAINEVLSPPRIFQQMRYIDETSWQDESMRNVYAKTMEPIVPEKNRFQNIVSDNYMRISLFPFPLTDPSSSYINAVKVDGFYAPFKFIVTQFPLNNTVGDFWRLIDQYNISLMICLNELDLSDETCCKFYPMPNKLIRPTPYLEIECTNVLEETYYKIHVINFNNSDKKEDKRIINILHLNKWRYSMLHPETTAELLMTYEKMNALGKTSKTILVTCLDGTRASGLFTSLCCLIDKIKMEHVCDVCLAVRTVRHSRADFVRQSEQFSFLYKCALDYVNEFRGYSNFSFRK